MMTSTFMDEYNNEESLGKNNGLQAQLLLGASPSHYGTVLKLHIPTAYSLLPDFLQKRVSAESYISYIIAPTWKERELILCGSYLYRFLTLSSRSPKGTPIALKGVSARIIDSEDDDIDGDGLEAIMENLPPGVNAIFALSSFGKSRYFAVATREEAVTWVNSIREARQESITRSMGHSKMPYPKSWNYFDRVAATLIKKKERMQLRNRQSINTEFENASIGGALRPIY